MKLKYEITTMEVNGELMAVPLDNNKSGSFNGILKMNSTTKDILDLLKEDTTEENIVKAMLDIYDTTEDIMRNSVHKIIEALRNANLLED